jgi:uncharacterized protein (DUF1800 family)
MGACCAIRAHISAPQQIVAGRHARRMRCNVSVETLRSSLDAHAAVSTLAPVETQALAAHRFGFGVSAGDRAGAERDGKAWLIAQLDAPLAGTPLAAECFGALPGSDTTGAVFPSLLRRAGLMRGSMGGGAAQAGAAQDAVASPRDADQQPAGEQRAMTRLLPYLTAELEARMRHAVATPAPLLDRLVWFWSNHFTVSARRIGLVALVGPYEREAIRPHVIGRFEDLLLASIRHPAMQIYLDNFRSVGPSTPAVGSGFGAQRRNGVNENLAREILELHTLGDRAVYTQADVSELALALTGWGLGFGGGFRFDERAHEPGARTLLGRRYEQDGALQAQAMLADLARHPATARHLARKLLRHFVALEPRADDVERLAAAYMGSGGDLRAMTRTLLHTPDAWRIEGARRARPADELVASAWRTLGSTPPTGAEIHAQLDSLGQRSWWAGSPAGWPESSLSVLGPDALLARVQWAQARAERASATLDARAVADQRYGALLGQATRREIERAASGTQALALLLASPEFLQS